MKIVHILNNSAAICLNNSSQSVVVIGKGITFNKKEGDDIDTSRIDRIYTHENDKIIHLINQIPDEYFDMTTVIIRYAERKLERPLADDAYFVLSDHIRGIMYRYKKNIRIPFGFLEQTELFYRNEYKIAEWIVDYLDAALNVDLPLDEIGFITIDMVNLGGNNNAMEKLESIMEIVHLIEAQVNNTYPKINKDSFSYKRFLTHLEYYAFRFVSNKEYKDSNIDFQFSDSFIHQTEHLIKSINSELQEKYGHSMDKLEKNYLLLHLQRLIYSNH